MTKRYLVIDQNYLREPELKTLLDIDPSVQIVLTDTAFIEITKSPNRELTLRQSLAILSNYTNRVIISYSIAEALRIELQSKTAINNHMHFREATKFIRQVLAGIPEGKTSKELIGIINDSEDHMAMIRNDYLDHEFNKERATKLVDVTNLKAGAELNKKIRSSNITENEYINFVLEKTPSLLISVLSNNGFNEEQAKTLMRKKPMLLRYLYLKVWASLKWEEMGRLESLAAPKVTNDLLDHDYVLTATFFDGLISNDKRMNAAFDALTKVLAKPIHNRLN